MATALINLTAHYNEIKETLDGQIAGAKVERLEQDVLKIVHTLGSNVLFLEDDGSSPSIDLQNVSDKIDTIIITGTGIDDVVADKIENLVEEGFERVIVAKNSTLVVSDNLNYSSAKPFCAANLTTSLVNKANFAFAKNVEEAIALAQNPEKFKTENAWRFLSEANCG